MDVWEQDLKVPVGDRCPQITKALQTGVPVALGPPEPRPGVGAGKAEVPSPPARSPHSPSISPQFGMCLPSAQPDFLLFRKGA